MDYNKYKKKFNGTYLTGLLLALNGLKDGGLFIDGPDCNFFRSDVIYKNHDFFSDIKDPIEGHRITHTGLTVNNVVKGYEENVKNKIKEFSSQGNISHIFLSTMPVADMLGIQYSLLFSKLSLDKGYSIIQGSIDKDRIDGYDQFLLGFSKYLIKNLSNSAKEENSVTIVGNMYSRNEGDDIGNIEEMKRMLKKIGVKVNCVWLEGERIENLKQVEKSSCIVSLPYGRKSANFLSEKLDIPLIETVTPFGIENTIKFLKDIGYFFKKYKKTDNYIKKEVNKFLNISSYSIKNHLFGKKFVISTDPFYIDGILNFSNILGFDVVDIYSMSNKDKYKEISEENRNIYNINYNFPDRDIEYKRNDLYFITNSLILKRGGIRDIELGFPSKNTHYFNKYPYFGFKGAYNFLEKLVNNI